MLAPYRAVLAVPGARPFVLAALIGRAPMSMLGIGTVLLVETETDSYALAGAVAATLALAQALSGPLLGRLVDAIGQRVVLLPSLAVHAVGLVALILAATGGAPRWTLFVTAALSGASVPLLSSMVRARWSALLGRSPELRSAFALESVLDEVVFVVGPVLVALLASALSPAAALGTALGFALTGGLAFAALRTTEPLPHVYDGDRPEAAIRTPGLRVLVAAFLAMGIVFGGIEVSLVAFADERGSASTGGGLLAIVAFASMVGGLVYGALHWSQPLDRRYVASLVVFALCVAPFPLAGSVPLMGLVCLFAGLAIAPSLIGGYELIERLVPAGSLTEGLTWVSTAVSVGLAIGASVAGWLADAEGARRAFLVAVAGALVAVTAAALGRRRLRIPQPLIAAEVS